MRTKPLPPLEMQHRILHPYHNVWNRKSRPPQEKDPPLKPLVFTFFRIQLTIFDPLLSVEDDNILFAVNHLERLKNRIHHK